MRHARPLLAFAALSAACFLLLGAVLANRLSRILEHRALQNSVTTASTVLSVVTQTFDGTARGSAPGPNDILLFSRQMKILAGRQGARSLTVSTRSGSLRVLGHVPADPQHAETLHRVLDEGKTVTRRVGSDYVLDLPLRPPGDSQPIAVFSSTVPVALVDHGVSRDLDGLYLILGAGLAFLWAILLPIFARVSRQLRRHADESERLARHDGLTGLANRSWFYEQAAHAHQHGPVGALVIDVDGFKTVNDTFGHGAGDDVLRTIARRLRATLRDDDLVARIGGDEFAVAVRRVDRDELGRVADRIVERLSAPLRCGDDVLEVGVSVGVAVPVRGEQVGLEQLFGEADRAMYRAKRCGGRTRSLELVHAL